MMVVLGQAERREACRLMNLDADTARTAVESACLMNGFVAEFVAESDSLEGCDASPADVLDSVRDLALSKIGSVMTRVGSAALAAVALAAALALPTAARADVIADGDAVERPQRQCDAAMETHDRFNMSVYCAIAAEKIAILTIGHPKSDLWADLRTEEAGDLLLAAGSQSRMDIGLAEDQMRAALRIMNEVVALYPNAHRIYVRQIIRDAVKTF